MNPAKLFSVACVLVLVACTDQSKTRPGQKQGVDMEMTIHVSSTAFDEGARIPRKYTGEGEDVSPPLAWTGAPDGTREFALICDDPDAPTPDPWVHWVLYRIPGNANSLAEGTSGGAVEGKNDFGKTGYGGPMPPVGHGMHNYYFHIYALDTQLELKPGISKDQLLAAMEGHIIAQGRLVGTYERR